MTTTDTNIQPSKSFKTDWSEVWSTTKATDYVIMMRTSLALVILTIVYIAGCFFHATGLGLINIIIGTIAMLMIVINAARPLMLVIFGLGGAFYAGTDKNVDLGPGIKAGLVNLGRLANAVMLFIGLTFFLLGTWPLSVPNWMYAILPMGVALIVNMIIYEKIKSKGWVWLLGGTYVIAILLYGAFSEAPIVKAIFGWADVKQAELTEAINESAANGGSTTQTAAPVKATASNSALGDIDPITVPPGTTSIEVRNWPGQTICWAAGLPSTVIREEKLEDGSWVVYTPGGTNVAHRWRNTGGTTETVYPYRNQLADGCSRASN